VTARRDVTRALPLVQAARVVFDIALDQMVLSRRSLMAALLLSVPAALAAVYRIALWRGGIVDAPGPYDLYNRIVALYEVRNVVPIVALLYATSLIADEVEGKTITYLFSRPVSRPAILAGKFAAYVATALAAALPGVAACFLLLATAPGAPGVAGGALDLVKDLGTIALALVSYGALFTLLGALLRRPVIPSLLFLFPFELVANLPGFMPRFTLTAYLRSLLRYQPAPEGPFPIAVDILPSGLCIGVILGASVVFLAAAGLVFSRREFVLDQ